MNLLKAEDGVVMVVAALMLSALLIGAAIVVDVGQLYLTRSQLQAAVDAAALPGAYALIENNQDETKAIEAATSYITSNVQSPYQFTPIVNPNNSTSTFQANLSKQVNFYFAPLIGIRSQTVTVTATAAANNIIAVTGVVPFGVVKKDFEFGEQYILKYGAKRPCDCQPHSGNYGALALGKNGASTYRDNIKNGYKEIIRVGDTLTTEPGNMAGPTDQGVSYRKSLCTGSCSYLSQIEANCPRVIITPVIDSLPRGGRGSVTVVGFAAFFLEDTVDSSSIGQKDIVGRFLKWTASGEQGDSEESFGLYAARLIK